jgi:hypothetical protein
MADTFAGDLGQETTRLTKRNGGKRVKMGERILVARGPRKI